MQDRSQVFDLTLLSNFLHQIVNPLNGVCGTLDNITDNVVPSGSVPQRLRAARAQLEHCISLVRNLAFFAELSRDPEGYRAAHPNKVSVVPKVVVEAAMFFQESARKKNMNIILVDKDTQYKVPVDPDLLRQVFMNLFDNAVKYGHSRTDILFKCHIQKKTGDLMIEVIGSSQPVPRELRERIFELGFRGENARQILASGTGLGLYICKIIIQFFGGSIEYKSRAEHSESLFMIRIPGAYV